MTELSPKGTALVTGASMGIGAVYADRLARRGYDLLLVARDQAKLEDLAVRLRAETGRKVEVLKADLADKADLLAVETRLRDDASITALVNNAGIAVTTRGALAESDPDKIEAMIDLNVVALTRLTLAALPGFVARDTGAVINIGSVVPLIPEAFSNIYASTKAYVLHFTQALQAQTAHSGIRVQAVLPGATSTAIWEKSGTPLSSLPPEILMPVEEMVDAALAGFDHGELVTIPALADPALWEQFTTARLALGPHLSLKSAAPRFKAATSQAA